MSNSRGSSFESAATQFPVVTGAGSADASSGVSGTSRERALDDDAAAPIPEIGTILDGKFRIDGILGSGGMAVVLAATHLQLEQRVAIKLLLPSRVENPEIVARFLVEGRSASKIRSEHVVRVLDVGNDEERPYLVMEYLDGTDLDLLLAKDGPLPAVLAVDYLLQACEAIAEAHVGGIIHRDLKPANLFLTHRADGAACVKVLDFGISKVIQPHNAVVVGHETSPLLVMGSPHYMSPEQMKSSRSVDQRSDLWSLGAILHELVAGTPPFQGTSITALCAAILMDPPPSLTSLHGDVPPALESVVRRCLEKDPANRFANVAQLAAALAPLGSEAARVSATCIERVLGVGADIAGGERASVPRPPQPTAAETLAGGPRARRFHAGHIGAIVALLAAGSGIGWMIVQSHRAVRAADAIPGATAALVAPSSVASASITAPPIPAHTASPVATAATAAPTPSPRRPSPPRRAPAASAARPAPTFAPPAGTNPALEPTPSAADSAENPY
jgi:serine/threonine-protein kinase